MNGKSTYPTMHAILNKLGISSPASNNGNGVWHAQSIGGHHNHIHMSIRPPQLQTIIKTSSLLIEAEHISTGSIMDIDVASNTLAYADSAYVVSVNNVAREKIPDTLYVCQFQPGNNDSTDSYHLIPSGVIYDALVHFDSNFYKATINRTGDILDKFMKDNFRSKLISVAEKGVIRQNSDGKSPQWSKDTWLYKPNGGLYNSQWKGEQVTFEVTYKNKVFKVVYNLKPQYPEKVFESEYDGRREYVAYCGKHKYLERGSGIYISSNNLNNIKINLSELAPQTLGLTTDNGDGTKTITLDDNGAGYGWYSTGADVASMLSDWSSQMASVFMDSLDQYLNPVGNYVSGVVPAAAMGTAFTSLDWLNDYSMADIFPDADNWLPTSNPNEWVAKAGSAAANKMDLLSVLLHEYGHAMGLSHSDDSNDVMAATLTPGVRRLPSLQEDGTGEADV